MFSRGILLLLALPLLCHANFKCHGGINPPTHEILNQNEAAGMKLGGFFDEIPPACTSCVKAEINLGNLTVRFAGCGDGYCQRMDCGKATVKGMDVDYCCCGKEFCHSKDDVTKHLQSSAGSGVSNSRGSGAELQIPTLCAVLLGFSSFA